jgi:hypothetical protein
MSNMAPIMSEEKTERFALRMTPTELAMLNELMRLTGLSAADVVRQAIRREHAEKLGPPQPPRPPKGGTTPRSR